MKQTKITLIIISGFILYMLIIICKRCHKYYVSVYRVYNVYNEQSILFIIDRLTRINEVQVQPVIEINDEEVKDTYEIRYPQFTGNENV